MILGAGIDRVDLEEFSRMRDEVTNIETHIYTVEEDFLLSRTTASLAALRRAGRIWLTVWNGIPGAGHYLPEEKPGYLTAARKAFKNARGR